MKKVLILCVVAAIIAAVVLYGRPLLERYSQRIAALEQEIAAMQEEFVPIRFKITKKTDAAMDVDVKFYDSDGVEVGSRSLHIEGQELHVDFRVLPLGDSSYLFFPSKVFSDSMAAEDGTSLFASYERDGFPLVYQSQGDGIARKRELSRIFSAVKGGEELSDRQYGNAIHDIKELAGFKEGFVYKAICHPHTGGIDLRKE